MITSNSRDDWRCSREFWGWTLQRQSSTCSPPLQTLSSATSTSSNVAKSSYWARAQTKHHKHTHTHTHTHTHI